MPLTKLSLLTMAAPFMITTLHIYSTPLTTPHPSPTTMDLFELSAPALSYFPAFVYVTFFTRHTLLPHASFTLY